MVVKTSLSLTQGLGSGRTSEAKEGHGNPSSLSPKRDRSFYDDATTKNRQKEGKTFSQSGTRQWPSSHSFPPREKKVHEDLLMTVDVWTHHPGRPSLASSSSRENKREGVEGKEEKRGPRRQMMGEEKEEFLCVIRKAK